MAKGQKKGIGFYFRVYFLSLCIGLLVFASGTYVFKKSPCANSKTCQSDLVEKIENGAIGTFAGQKVIPPIIDIAYDTSKTSVLGAEDSSGEKQIYIDLEAQTLYAYQGDKKVFQALISSGRWGKTPVGNFHIWHKVRATRMSGGSGSDYYNLPNVPYVMYFYGDFGLHGAYWHNNFGHTMSHGCVNMREVDAKELFAWTDGPEGKKKGTKVSVCNQFVGPNNCIQNNPVKS